MERILTYDGKRIGKTDDEWVIPFLTEFGLQDLLRNMPVRDRIHISNAAPDVLKLVQNYGIPEEAYISNEDLAIYCYTRGYRNLAELNRGDHKAWGLIRGRRNLVSEIFGAVESNVRDKRRKGKK